MATKNICSGGIPGTLDMDFGEGGISLCQRCDVGLFHRPAYFAMDGDDSIFVSGITLEPVSYAPIAPFVHKFDSQGNQIPERFNKDGVPDVNFATDGFLIENFGNAEGAFLDDFALAPDGSLYLLVKKTGHGMAIVHLDANGKSFTSYPFTNPTNVELAQAFISYADSVGIVVVGTDNGDTPSTIIVNMNVQAMLNPDFGGGTGYVLIHTNPSPGHYISASGFALQGDGKIIVEMTDIFSTNSPPSTLTALIERYGTNGSLDTTFSSPDGKITETFGSTSAGITGALSLDDGRLLAIGSPKNPSDNFSHAVVTRYSADGLTDTGFGNSGIAALSLTGYNSTTGRAIGLDSQGRIIVLVWGTIYAGSGPPKQVIYGLARLVP